MTSPLVYAGALFEFLGHMGMTYMQHPSNPYQITAGKTDYVDYVQYPRETLKRNSGVCTDLVVLYVAALESIGIRTMVLGIPGHLFMMFALGPVSELGSDTMNGMLVVHDGYVWAPVELTSVKQPFMKAWEVGSKTYNEARNNGSIEMTDPRRAWARFKPATLPPDEWRVPVAGRGEVDRRFGHELAKINKLTLKFASSNYFRAARKNPTDANAYLQLGIIYGEEGEYEEALSFFEKAEGLSSNNAAIKNNIANLYYLRGSYKEALKYYQLATELDPGDPYILVNMSLCYLRMGMKEKGKSAFKRAYDKDPAVAQKYRAISLDLLGNL
jgi:hypothetical protein